MNPSFCVKRNHQLRLHPVFTPTTRHMQFSFWRLQNAFLLYLLCLAHTPVNTVRYTWSAAQAILWNFSSLNSLCHNLFVGMTHLGELVLIHILSKAGSGETLFAGALFCYLFLSPAMLAGSSIPAKHWYFIPYLRSYLRTTLRRLPHPEPSGLQCQG